MLSRRFLVATTLGFSSLSAAQTQQPKDFLKETTAQRDKRMEWFREARFGMFIHWGLYAVPAGEHNGQTNYGEWFLEETKMPVSQYERFANQWNPTGFDAKNIVQLAKNAGIKYIVITSKHHDGFAIYPSNLNDWNTRRTRFKRDPILELAQECKKANIKLCFYHSIMDWHHPDYTPRRAWNDVAPKLVQNPDMDRYVAFMKGQLKELLTRYGPIGILWFDGEWESTWNNQRGRDLYNYVRALQPNIIINNRVGKGRSGMQGMDNGEGVGDYGTPEQEIPPTGFGPGVDWESCMTMNNHWGYNKADQNWKSTQTLVRNLIDCASKGGNYLLNIGPMASGEVPSPSVERLQQIGAWMKTNSSAIYETTASPFKRLIWGRATTKTRNGQTTLFLHVWNWPTDGRLRVPGLKNAIQSARLLGAKSPRLIATNAPDGVQIQIPTQAPNSISSTIALTFKGAPQVEDVPLSQKPDGTLELLPMDAIVDGQIRIEQAADGKDNFGFWTNSKDTVEWKFRVTKPGRYQVRANLASEGESTFYVLLRSTDSAHTVQFHIPTPATGGYKTFRDVKLGDVQFDTANEYEVIFSPDAHAWNPINLRSLSLHPVP